MVIYLVCFDLSAPLQQQRDQIFYWLQFLNSSVPPQNQPLSNNNWRVMVIGLKSDRLPVDSPSLISAEYLQNWQSKWKNIPLFTQHLFQVSSLHSPKSVGFLLQSITEVCFQIFEQHTVLIPSSARNILQLLQSLHTGNVLIPFHELYHHLKDKCKRDIQSFELALHHLHSIGRILFLQNGIVCTTPTLIPKMLAKFISPAEVQNQLCVNYSVHILTQEQIGVVLQIDSNETRYFTLLCFYLNNFSLFRLKNEIEILLELQICFKIEWESGRIPYYIFPSLGSEGIILHCEKKDAYYAIIVA